MSGPPASRPLRTRHHRDYGVDDTRARLQEQGLTAAVVLPARDEEATVASVVSAYRPLVDDGVVDDLLVVDSLSTDATATVAAEAGARVVAVGDVHPEVPAVAGKGEALWRALLATDADLVVFCDADVLDAGPHYVLGLLGPLLDDPATVLVKGFYRRPIVGDGGRVTEHGGRVTELTARPLLNLHRPELGQLVQPLAGEWAGRRSHLESLPFPVGYGVEVAVLMDTYAAVGLDGMAQVDLGTRTHRHQSQAALGVMAAEVMAAAHRRLGLDPEGAEMVQFGPHDGTPVTTPIPLQERPAARTVRRP